MAEGAAAGSGQLELDLLSLGAVLVVVDFLGLRVLKVLLWALVGAEELDPAGLSPGHAAPEHLLPPAGRDSLGHAPQAQAVWGDWGWFADERLGLRKGTGYTILQDVLKSYLM